VKYCLLQVVRRADGKVYAMKRVKINKMSKKEISDTLNEVRFLASVRHPNIVGFYEAFIENNDTELCIIMEFCGCGDLAQKIERYKRKRQPIVELKIWGYLIQSLRALQELHNHGICHRDLKAANTFLAEDGSIKIGDMNVSKQLKQGKLQTQIGTPYYMSPEIWNNQSYDERCDIWSLGCMIYELAALRPPFLGDSFPSLKRSIILGRFPPLPRQYSESIQRVIACMLRVNSKERPTTQQLLASPDLVSKMESNSPIIESQDSARSLLETIKVPQILKKLNDVLPKACYPDVENMIPISPHNNNSDERSVGEISKQKGPTEQQRVSNMRPSPPSSVLQPCPPTGNKNNNVPRNHHHRIW